MRVLRIVLLLAVAALLFATSEPLAAKTREAACREPEIHIHKGQGELILTCAKRIRLRALVTFGGAPRGHKFRSGDQRTPEGRYFVCTKKRSKRFHRFLGISYPGPVDARRALRERVISKAQHDRIAGAHRRGRRPPWTTRLGGAIGIHGVQPKLALAVRLWNGVSRLAGLHRVTGFSDGCIVTNNTAIERLWRLVPLGTPVYIHPQRAKRSR